MNYLQHLINKASLVLVISLIYTQNSYAQLLPEKPIVVLVTSYNNKQWLEKNITSIHIQKYSNYRVIYIDDHSKDGTPDYVEALVNKLNEKKQWRFELIRNPERKGALANIFNGVHTCKNCEIVISLDGDDWFADDEVFSKINQTYSSGNIWLTHGTLKEYPYGHVAWCIPIPPEIVATNSFRSFRCPSHLRTFYAGLFKLIRPEDLMYNGQFFAMSWDQAMMFPMIEMAAERHAFIKDVVYIYNMRNPINDNKVDAALQNKMESWIRALPPYQRLPDDYDPTID